MQQRVPKGANATASRKRAQLALEAKAEDYKRTKREGVSWRPPCIKKHDKKKSKRLGPERLGFEEWARKGEPRVNQVGGVVGFNVV
uniref:Uncharacterized protein n=1 Tax=Fagus sylvatica TaxID=28930 RepID=A0A2N9IDQ1_FAGSY